MRLSLLVLTVLATYASQISANTSKHWAVLVAGSEGWDNYRHQSDVAHAYQLVRKNGIPPENIITMMVDDVATHLNNPFPGRLFQDYSHKDVYAGIHIDYTGAEVTVDNFLRMLMGDARLKALGKKVLESGPNDNVFIFMTGQGYPGYFGFPKEVLEAQEFVQTLISMNHLPRYNQMLIYITASFSGSMFDKLLPPKIRVLGLTSTTPDRTTHSVNCWDPSNLPCLSGEFSYHWKLDSFSHTLSKWTVAHQVDAVRSLMKCSSVQAYGDLNMAIWPLSQFQAKGNSKVTNATSPVVRLLPIEDAVPEDQIHLFQLKRRLSVNQSPEQMELARRRLNRATQLARMAKETVDEIMEQVYRTATPSDPRIDIYETLDCHKKIVEQFKIKCFSPHQVPEVAYEMQKFYRLCDVGYDSEMVVQEIFDRCG